MEETPGGQRRELLKPLHDYRLAIADAEAPDKDIETIYDERGIKAGVL